MKKTVFYFDYTDLYGGVLNYSWVTRLKVKATTLRGAVNILSRHIGVGGFRYDGIKYVSRSGCTAFYEIEWAQDMKDEHKACYKAVNFEEGE